MINSGLLTTGGKKIGHNPLAIRDPHDLGGGVRMIKGALGTKFTSVFI